MAESANQEEGIEECRYCGEPVDTLEPGVFKTVADQFAHPECVAEECYDSREKVATDRGVFTVKSVTIKKTVGTKEECIDHYWQAYCPACHEIHETNERSEDARSDLIDQAIDCCGAEWLPPEDYVEGCDVCGEDHRESRGCYPPAHREPVPGVEAEFECTDCDWDGDGINLEGPNGECPECDSAAVRVVEE